MATIDKLDISIYIQYARRTQMLEEIKQQYHLEDAASIPPQTLVMDITPKVAEFDLLFGISSLLTPWAHFMPPKFFGTQRRSPFAFARIAPSIGTAEQQVDLEDKVAATPCPPDQAKEKESLLSCFKQMNKINDWLSFITSRIGQFLQG